jgi:hypothetical protein
MFVRVRSFLPLVSAIFVLIPKESILQPTSQDIIDTLRSKAAEFPAYRVLL